MSLPVPTFELSANFGVVRSGSDVTSWGNASGGTSPTFSNDQSNRILNYPVIQFDGASSQYLAWNEISSIFSGDDPDFTAAILFRPRSASDAKTILGVGNAGNGRDEIFRVTGASTLFSSRRDDTLTSGSVTITGLTYNTTYLAIVRQQDETRSSLLHRMSDSVEVSNSATVDTASTTMASGAIGVDASGGLVDQFFTGDIARIRLYDSALSDTQLGELRRVMSSQLQTQRQVFGRAHMKGRARHWIPRKFLSKYYSQK